MCAEASGATPGSCKKKKKKKATVLLLLRAKRAKRAAVFTASFLWARASSAGRATCLRNNEGTRGAARRATRARVLCFNVHDLQADARQRNIHVLRFARLCPFLVVREVQSNRHLQGGPGHLIVLVYPFHPEVKVKTKVCLSRLHQQVACVLLVSTHSMCRILKIIL